MVSLLRQHLHQNSEFVAFFWGGHSAVPSHGQSTLNKTGRTLARPYVLHRPSERFRFVPSRRRR